MGMESFGGLESGTGHSIFLQAACQGKTLTEREGGLACKQVYFRKDFIEMYMLYNNDETSDFPCI